MADNDNIFHPGVILHEVITGAFRAKGTTFEAWCADNSVNRTKDGDVLDAICAKHYGDTHPTHVEDVIAANPGLAALGPVLPSGWIVELPEIQDTAQERPTIRLWD